MRRWCFLITVAAGAMLALPSPAKAQWTLPKGGWFMSHSFNVGSFPDRFSAGPGATENELDKVDYGLYFLYGWREGTSVGLGQGFSRLEQTFNGTTTTNTGFGSTGFFIMHRLAQGKAGILSIQPRIDLPLLFDNDERPALGPVEADAEIRLLYGNGFGIAGTRGFMNASAGISTIRAGNDEIRYDGTVGIDAHPRLLLMGQAFNVIGLADGGGIAYSATKLGASAVFRASPTVGLLIGYFRGVSGKNTSRERTFSIGIWLSHTPQSPVVPPQQ
ncbi:MAG: hypothetical protein SFU57_06490 [Gemmatimonadales bacterium]|jgi:hypothetical protein|nr:hypothetical protein [Gemmatimonadales bacterium]MDZ4259772.1 hypothetical protein [Gemmatimonadales bacterium]MDZ4391056.1 hypothetical protein [Gemmatimonadales bacterium]